MAVKLFQYTVVFYKLWKAIHAKNPDGTRKYNVIVLEGGSRSSKTFSIIQALMLLCIGKYRGIYNRILICRKDSQRARDTVWADLMNALKFYGFYKKENQRGAPMSYQLKDALFNCRGLLDFEKVVGAETDIAWLNEANQCSKDAFDELEQRNLGFMILDYNPNFSDRHWIPESLMKRPDVAFIHSTMLDNPFLPKKIIDKIRSYEPTDENIARGTANAFKWSVYGLGLKGRREGLVFPDFKIIPEVPAKAKFMAHGLDWGYTNDPTAHVSVWDTGTAYVIKENFYAKGMRNSQIYNTVAKDEDLSIYDKCVADCAEPKSIDEIHDMGMNIHPCKKGADSILYGIDKMLEKQILIVAGSVNVIEEFENYGWAKDKNGIAMNKPVDEYNHAIDAARYVIMGDDVVETGLMFV